jgi:phage tail-like protein
MTHLDLDMGRVMCGIGVTLLEPGEFVMLRIAIKTGNKETNGKPAKAKQYTLKFSWRRFLMAAPTFPANAHRHDPYRNFKFQVLIDGKPVAGLSKVSALVRKTEVVEWRSGGDPTHARKIPGRTSYEPITLEQGLTHDTVFEEWANLVNNIDGDAAMSLKNFRKDIVINLLNLQGTVAISYRVRRAWVSEYQALPELGADDCEVGIQRIVLEHEGWERDKAVTEPSED